MTTLQLNLALLAVKYNSISVAAKELRVSQPNASSSLKLLENELGFTIFKRSKSGITVTDKGMVFLEHAKRLVAEHNSIMDIKNHENVYRLRLGAVNYLSAAEPFLKLCEMHKNDIESDFSYFNVSIPEGIEGLDKYNLDIVFAPSMKSQVVGVKNSCKQKNLAIISLGEIPAVVSVRKGHPAIKDGRCVNLTQGSDAMKDFPYVAYRNLSQDTDITSYNDTAFARSSYVMYVDEVTVRLSLVAKTNAFCFGITPSKGVNERYGLVSFPVPGITLELFCFVREGEQDRTEIREYISLLKEELGIEAEAVEIK